MKTDLTRFRMSFVVPESGMRSMAAFSWLAGSLPALSIGKIGNSSALARVFPLLLPVVNGKFPGFLPNSPPAPRETRHHFLPDTRKTPAGRRPAAGRLSCQHARVKRVRAIASYWPVFSVDRSNSEFSSSKGTQEMSLATSVRGWRGGAGVVHERFGRRD